MRDTIWRYTLGPTYLQTLPIPKGFKVRHVAPVGKITDLGVDVWVEVDPLADKVEIDWFIVGTGHPLPPEQHGAIYCGTAVVEDGYVWHVFCAVPVTDHPTMQTHQY